MSGRIEVLRCGDPGPGLPEGFGGGGIAVRDLPAAPGRRDLRFLDSLPGEFLRGDATPSLAELAAQPDVPHQGAPQPAPQRPVEPVRVVVVGDDAACAATVTRLMRIDALWVEVAHVPTGPGAIARNWGLGGTDAAHAADAADLTAALEFALTAPARPTPLVRDDSGTAVLGAAEVMAADGGEMTGEVIVDSGTLLSHEAAPGRRSRRPRHGAYGVRLVPTMDAPGIAAVRLTTPSRWAAPGAPTGGEGGADGGVLARLRGRLRPAPPAGGVDASSVMAGRALQAGGVDLRVVRDGVAHPRPLSSVTFYRHLRDAQVVRR